MPLDDSLWWPPQTSGKWSRVKKAELPQTGKGREGRVQLGLPTISTELSPDSPPNSSLPQPPSASTTVRISPINTQIGNRPISHSSQACIRNTFHDFDAHHVNSWSSVLSLHCMEASCNFSPFASPPISCLQYDEIDKVSGLCLKG